LRTSLTEGVMMIFILTYYALWNILLAILGWMKWSAPNKTGDDKMDSLRPFNNLRVGLTHLT